MQLSEKEIEDLIFKDLIENNGEDINDRGLNMPFMDYRTKVKWLRQLDIQPYGIIDIVGFYRHRGMLHADLLELKAVPIEARDFDQIFRYKTGLQVFTRKTFKRVNINVNPILIGTGFSTGYYIQNNVDIIISELTYGVAGFSFNTYNGFNGWTVKNDDNCNFRKLLGRPSKQPTNGKAVY